MADKVKGLARRLAYPPRKLEPPQVKIVLRPRLMSAVLDINIAGLPTDDLHGRAKFFCARRNCYCFSRLSQIWKCDSRLFRLVTKPRVSYSPLRRDDEWRSKSRVASPRGSTRRGEGPRSAGHRCRPESLACGRLI